MPSHRNLSCMPCDNDFSAICEAISTDTAARMLDRWALKHMDAPRDPRLTAFEGRHELPAETVRFDIAADYQYMKPAAAEPVNRGGWIAHDPKTYRVMSPPCAGIKWVRRRGGLVHEFVVGEWQPGHSVFWREHPNPCSGDFIAYSLDQVCPEWTGA